MEKREEKENYIGKKKEGKRVEVKDGIQENNVKFMEGENLRKRGKPRRRREGAKERKWMEEKERENRKRITRSERGKKNGGKKGRDTRKRDGGGKGRALREGKAGKFEWSPCRMENLC